MGLLRSGNLRNAPPLVKVPIQRTCRKQSVEANIHKIYVHECVRIVSAFIFRNPTMEIWLKSHVSAPQLANGTNFTLLKEDADVWSLNTPEL